MNNSNKFIIETSDPIHFYGGCSSKEIYTREILQNFEYPAILFQHESQIIGHIKLEGAATFLSYTHDFGLKKGGFYCLHKRAKDFFEYHIYLDQTEAHEKFFKQRLERIPQKENLAKILLNEHSFVPMKRYFDIWPAFYGSEYNFEHDLERFLEKNTRSGNAHFAKLFQHSVP